MKWNETQLKNFFLEILSSNDEGMAVKQIEEILNTEYSEVCSENIRYIAEKLQNCGYIKLNSRGTQSGKTSTAIITRAGERLLDEGGFR